MTAAIQFLHTATFQHQSLQIHIRKMAVSFWHFLLVTYGCHSNRQPQCWMLCTASLKIYAVTIIGSSLRLAEPNDLQKDKHIQQLVKPGNGERHMQGNMAEPSGEYPTHRHK